MMRIVFYLAFCVIVSASVDGTKRETCDVCKDTNWLFVVATGRSGSTTILNMLNAIPQIFLAGENGGIMASLLNVYKNQYSTAADIHIKRKLLLPEQFSEEQPGYDAGPWYHPDVPLKEEQCDIQSLTRDVIGIDQLNASNNFRIIGFKEIRFSPKQLDIMATSIFPCAKFILNIRVDTKEQHKSAMQKKVSLTKLNNDNRDLLRWAEKHSRKVFQLPLENFTLTNYNSMLRWLGITQCNYTKILHLNANGSYYRPKKKKKSITEVLDHPSKCHFNQAATSLNNFSFSI